MLRPLSSPRLETMKGTTKLVPHLIQVIAVASPRTITMPTRSAIRTVRRRCSRRRRRRARRASRARTRRIRAVPSQAARRVATGDRCPVGAPQPPWATAVRSSGSKDRSRSLYLRGVRGGQGNQLDVARVDRSRHPNLKGSQPAAAGKDESGVGDALGGLPRHAFLRCILVPPLPLVSPRTLRSADTYGRCSSARGLLSRRSRRPP